MSSSQPPTLTTPTPKAPSARTRAQRMPTRARYDRASIDAILDEALVAHVGFAVQEQPYVIPTLHARVDDSLYFHGSSASRTVRALAAGTPVCLTVTLLDGLVLARSAVHHSVNYRSVVVFGQASAVEDMSERMSAIEAFTERLVPGRWSEVRPPTAKELKAIQVLQLPLTEASAKLRSGPPLDDEEDYALNTWAGVIPLRTLAGEPVDDARLPDGVSPSRAALRWASNRSR
jgi:nitroimidazol reductase NimA-like FMN-containing flavoprotein (pyridoxamine 5'-phosphate oxidase superfamily)